jgi:hypothetical protein
MSSRLLRLRSRQITERDVDAIVDLLARGFTLRSRGYWQRALATLGQHPTPAGMPKYGYLLEAEGVAVGVILLIFSSIPTQGAPTIRCNLSSWYVEPAYRGHASLLIAQAIKHKNVTYVNVSPAMHTRPIIEAQGFSPYSKGQFVSIPALAPSTEHARIIGIEHTPDAGVAMSERELLQVHRDYGCISLWCETDTGARPFVFMPRLVKGVIPCAQLIYCRDISDFVRFARPIGRYLARRGRPLVIIDSDGPIVGLVGRYFAGKSPKYFKGATQPTFGDLAYTEAVMFGL